MSRLHSRNLSLKLLIRSFLPSGESHVFLFVAGCIVNIAGLVNCFQVSEITGCCSKYDTIVLKGRKSDMGGWFLGGKSIIIPLPRRRKTQKLSLSQERDLFSFISLPLSVSLSLSRFENRLERLPYCREERS